MKKLISTLFISMLIGVSHAQEQSMKNWPKTILQCVDQLGKDSSAALNSCESAYFDYCFQKERGSFSFKNRTVFFLRGSAGSTISDKKTYFERIEMALDDDCFPCYFMQQLIIFDDGEREKFGYDAAIATWSKRSLTKKHAIKQIKKHRKKR